MYPKYFLPDFGPSSGEDLLQKWCNFCFSILLYIDLLPGQTCHSKVMHQKEVTHSDDSYGKKSRRWAWLTIWDKVKSHGTVIDWCTEREWPVNCMTVISAWWRSNMPFQRLSWAIELSYNSVKTGSQRVWRPDPLVTRYGRESPQVFGWAALESGKETLMAIWVGVNRFQSLFSLQLPLTHKRFK